MLRYFAISFACMTMAGCVQERPPEPRIGMPNPASEYCVKQGGRLEIRKGEAGESGYCHLPDGRIVEEWDLFRQANGPKGE